MTLDGALIYLVDSNQIQSPRFSGLVVCCSLPDCSVAIELAKIVYPGAVFNSGSRRLVFPAGGSLYINCVTCDSDVNKFISYEFSYIAADQKLNSMQIKTLSTRLRIKAGLVPVLILFEN